MPVTLDIADDFIDVVDNLEAITLRPPEGENSNGELVTNPRFDTDLDDWTKSGAVAWDERLALIQSASPYLYQAISTTAGVTYLVALDVFAYWDSTAPTIRIGTSANGTQIGTQTVTASGRTQFTFVASGSTTYLTLKNGDGVARYGAISARASGDTSVASSLRRAVSNREAAASGGQYRMGDVKWHLPESLVSSPPVPGAIITDGDGARWTVLAVDQETWNNRWKCWTRRLSTADVSLGTVTVQKRIFTKDADGAQVGTLDNWANHVRAKIQRADTANATQEHLRRSPNAVTIHFEQQLPLDHRFAVVAADGRVYKPTGYRDWQRIDGLFVVDAEESPWPLN